MNTDNIIQVLTQAFNSHVEAAVKAQLANLEREIREFVANEIAGLQSRLAILEARDLSLVAVEEKLTNLIDEKVQNAMDAHSDEYDHDSYDNVASNFDSFDPDDYVTGDELHSAIRDELRNVSISLDV